MRPIPGAIEVEKFVLVRTLILYRSKSVLMIMWCQSRAFEITSMKSAMKAAA